MSLRLPKAYVYQFLRKVEREVRSDTANVSKSSLFGTRESYMVTKVTEWFWRLDVSWELQAFRGNQSDAPIRLRSHVCSIELKTAVDRTPHPAVEEQPSLDLQLTWLLQQLERPSCDPMLFVIRRQDAHACRTPRRNAQVEEALAFISQLHRWAAGLDTALRTRLLELDPDSSDISGGNAAIVTGAAGVFVPVLPLLQKTSGMRRHTSSRRHLRATVGSAKDLKGKRFHSTLSQY
jgi:hypothetical protein